MVEDVENAEAAERGEDGYDDGIARAEHGKQGSTENKGDQPEAECFEECGGGGEAGDHRQDANKGQASRKHDGFSESGRA